MIRNFGAIPIEVADENTARGVVLPVPCDETSTWMKGAGKGPAAIIEALAEMALFDTATGRAVSPPCR